MSEKKHVWKTFIRRKIKVRACANCGEMNLPGNKESHCHLSGISDSQIFRAGYRMMPSTTLV